MVLGIQDICHFTSRDIGYFPFYIQGYRMLCSIFWSISGILDIYTGGIPISLFLLATGTILRKAAIDRGVRLATGRYGCRQISKPSNSTVSVLI